MKKSIEYNGFTLSYLVINPFPEEKIINPTLAFHGFGRKAEDFNFLSPILQKGDVVYSFNLFQHGNSKSPDDRLWKKALTENEFRDMMEFVFDKLNINTFNLIGYSMGGRIAFKITELFPEKIKNLTLIAPDGLKLNFGYLFVTQTWLGRKLFKYFIYNSQILLYLSEKLLQLGWLKKSTGKLVNRNMSTLQQRKQVGETWFIYSNISINSKIIQEIINKHDIKIKLIFGKYDRIIPPSIGEKFNAGFTTDSLIILDSGHMLLDENLIKYLSKK